MTVYKGLGDLFDQETLGAEVITSGGMEAGAGDPVIPTDWANSGQDAGEASAIDTSDYYSGSASYDLNVNAALEGINQGAITVVVGTVYKLVVYFKRVSGSLQIRAINDGNWHNETLTSGYATWTAYTAYFLAHQTSTTLYFTASGAAARWKIDSVSMKPVTAGARGEFNLGNLNSTVVCSDNCQADSVADWTEADNAVDPVVFDTDKYELSTDGGAGTFTLDNKTVVADTTYRVTADIIDDTQAGATIQFHFDDGAAQRNSAMTTTASWVTHTWYVTAASSVATAKLGIYEADDLTTSTFAIRNFMVSKVDLSWTRYGTNALEIDEDVGSGGALYCAWADNANGSYVLLANASDLTSNLTIGALYEVVLDTKVGAGDTVSIRIAKSGATQAAVSVTETSFTSKTLRFTAISINTHYLEMQGMAAGEEVWIDNLTIEKVIKGSGGYGYDYSGGYNPYWEE